MTEEIKDSMDEQGEQRKRPTLTGPEIREGEKYFSQEDLNLYELAQYKVANARQAVRLKQHEAEEYQRKANATLSQMQFHVKQLKSQEEQLMDALRRLQAAVSKKYELDLTKITYDDETGRIQEPPPSDVGAQPTA